MLIKSLGGNFIAPFILVLNNNYTNYNVMLDTAYMIMSIAKMDSN